MKLGSYRAELTEEQLDRLADEIVLYKKFKGRGIKFIGICCDAEISYIEGEETKYSNFIVGITVDRVNPLNEYMVSKYGFKTVDVA